MKKLYLHMGFHKTATSSFQATCKKNVDALYAQGFCYPLFNSEQAKLKDIENHSFPIFSLFTKSPKNYHLNIKWKVDNIISLNSDYMATLESSLLLDSDIIISGEDISVLSISALTDLKHFIEKYKFTIVPLVVVRSPYEFHCSATQQRVKGGGETSLVNFTSQISKIETMKAVFSDIEFISFKESCKYSSGPVGYLLEKIGINSDGFSFISTNEGVSNAHVRSQVLINRVSPVIINGKRNDHWRRVCGIGNKYFQSKFLLTQEEVTQIKKDLDRENDFFDHNLGEKFKDKKIDFCDATVVYEELAGYFLSSGQLKKRNGHYPHDAALKSENRDLNLPSNLMRLVCKAKKSGPFIKRKLAEYRAKMRKHLL